ncbi:peptidoglycan editing factor PgeF [Marinicrinis sediminis]|uniref:Purine nucleoside phosphorylase n=1 Tax=Marinicrinis sediminis TaxID=1652465 RepID=A0ABW5RC24_9BACL
MREPFQLKQHEELRWLELSNWMEQVPGLQAGFSTRIGGQRPATSLAFNTALHVGDEAEQVIANRKRLAEALPLPFHTYTCAEQVHGCSVHRVTREDAGSGRESRDSAIPNADALITDEPGVWLASFYADCVPIYLLDPVHRVIGLAHAGWKGTTLEIARHTMEAMQKQYGSKPEEMRAAIGPAIGICCYEVDARVYEACKSLFTEAEWNRLEPVLMQQTDESHWRANLKECNRQIMMKAGIMATHIECTEYCTACRQDLFFSHRKEAGKAGRMMSWIAFSDEGERNASSC